MLVTYGALFFGGFLMVLLIEWNNPATLGPMRFGEKVLAALNEAVSRVCAEGFEPAAFERGKRASYGARLRGLEDFESVCVALATAQFEGF